MSIRLLPRCIPDVLNVRDPRSSGWPVWFLVPVSDVKAMGGHDGCQLPQMGASLWMMWCRLGSLKNSGSRMIRTILFGNLNLQGLDIQWYSMAARYPGVKFNLQIALADLAPKRPTLPHGLLVPLAIPTLIATPWLPSSTHLRS